MEYVDTIIIGAGHNGLVCATYLTRSGQQVLVLEASEAVGGLAATRRSIRASRRRSRNR